MPHHDAVALSGTILNVFAHRFTVEADGKVHLANLTPDGANAFKLAEGLQVTLKGEQKPSEIKVTEIAARGRPVVAIHHKKPGHGSGDRPAPHEPGRRPPPHVPAADVAVAIQAAQPAGWTVNGTPSRKPQHFEVLARQNDGPWTELHVDLDGRVYKTKPLPPDGGKWAERVG